MAPRKFAKRRPRFSKAKAKPRKASSSLVKTIKRVISNRAEKKCWFDYGVNQSIASVIAGNPSFKNLVPVLSQGITHSTRIGNEVRVKSGYIRGHVNILPYNIATNYSPTPTYVKMWLCRYKLINTNNIATTNISINFLDVVSGSVGLQGNMLDMSLSPNKDAWDVLATKVVRVGAGFMTSTGPVTSTGYYDNSPMSVPFAFNFGKHLKTLKYDDATNTVTNKNLFLVFQCVPADGQSGNGQIQAEFHYSTRVEYEDM